MKKQSREQAFQAKAIALSTIHTVHRLISSTLSLEELLPRVTRLTMQVLRARKCALMLLDENKRYLLTKAVADLTNKHPQFKKVQVGEGTEGKVAQTGNAVMRSNLLSVPLVHEDVVGVITVRDKIDRKSFTIFDKEILSTLSEQAVIAIHNAKLYEEQQRITIGAIKSLAAILDAKSPYTYTHSAAFVKIALAIGRELKLSLEELRNLHYAALLPDAGKIWVPEEILRKPKPLTGREYRIVKEHPIKGVEIIRHIKVLKPVVPVVLHHHERYDGTGYPDGLKGEAIPLGARIMAVADAFEAMTGKRPYRAVRSAAQAAKEIKRFSGTQFDPKVVDAFLKLMKNGKVRTILKGRNH